MSPVQAMPTPAKGDLDLDFIGSQLRGTFDARLEQMLALPAGDPANQPHIAALDAINAALARIHSGTYGQCESCGGTISPARLEVIPTTIHCTPCKRIG